jgi:hypothetical protein
MIQAARRLYKPAHRKLHISQVVDLNRRFVIGYNMFKDDPKVIELQHKVLAYNQLLKYHGLMDHQVPKTDLRRRETFALLSYRLMILTVWGLLAFPGAILNLPIAVVAKYISTRKAKGTGKFNCSFTSGSVTSADRYSTIYRGASRFFSQTSRTRRVSDLEASGWLGADSHIVWAIQSRCLHTTTQN